MDASGAEKYWDFCERTTKKPSSSADGALAPAPASPGEPAAAQAGPPPMHAAVSIFCVIKGGGAAPTTLLVKQFRPPTGAMCLEFPAGLIDSGESAEAAALRELKEETARKQAPPRQQPA